MKPLIDAQVSAIIQRVMHGDATGLLAIAYGRVSSAGQVKGVSLQGQRGRAQRWADERRITVVSHYEEPGESAWKGKRPVFQQLLADLPQWRRQGVCLLLVYQLDRFARNLHYALNTLQTLREHGIIVVSVVDMVDYTTADGWKAMMSRLTDAEGFSRVLSRVIRDTRLTEAQDGRPIGPMPTGYSRRDGAAYPNDRADQQRYIFARFASGEYSCETLAHHMNTLGYRVWSEQQACDVPYTKYSIGDMLRNPFYIGQIRINGVVYSGNHERIIDQPTWDAVQALFVRRRRARPVIASNDRIFTGLLSCVHCGVMLWQHHMTGSGATYRCPGRERRQCQAQDVPEAVIMPYLHTLLSALVLPTDWQTEVITRTVEQLDPAPIAPVLDRERERRAARLRFLDGELSEAEYTATIAEIDAPPAAAQAVAVDMVRALTYLQNLPTLFARGGVMQRRALLKSLIETLYVDKGSGVVAVTPRAPYHDLLVASTHAALIRWEVGEPGGDRTHQLPIYRIPSVWSGYMIPVGPAYVHRGL